MNADMKKTALLHSDLISTGDLCTEPSVPRHVFFRNKLISLTVIDWPTLHSKSGPHNDKMFLSFAHTAKNGKWLLKRCLHMKTHPVPEKSESLFHVSSVSVVLFFFHCCILNARFSMTFLKKCNFLNCSFHVELNCYA